MKATQTVRRSRRGFVLIYYTLCLMVILPLVGLAIDLGMLYNVRSKLNAAIDGASLAAGRSLSRGVPFEAAQPLAVETARRFFWANFPQGYWGARVAPDSPVVSVVSANNRITVNVTASVQSPLMFMRVFNTPTSRVGAGASAIRRDINLVLVLDRSGSISQAGASSAVRDSSKDFVNQLIEGQDWVGLVSFSGNVRLHFTPETNFKDDAATAIDGLVFSGNTNSAAGLSEAYRMIKDLNQPGALNVIVFFTDGRPTALTAVLETPAEADNSRYGLPSKNDTGTARTYKASTCTYHQITAFISAPGGWPPETKGTTWALGKPFWTLDSDTDDTFADALNNNANGCLAKTGGIAYRRNGNDYRTNGTTLDGRADVAYVPPFDFYGNEMVTSYKPAVTFSSGRYTGNIRPDSTAAIRYAAYNAVDSCARAIREDSTYKPVVFTIGLGGTTEESIDAELLERLANDPRSTAYDSTRPVGLYVEADTTQKNFGLSDAYTRVMSQILRLAQ